jgi:phosphoribosylanthranilate isomerase
VTACPRVKICCIASLAEARTAIGCGAHALGLVSAMPSGPGVIDEAAIAEIAARVPPGVASFLLTSLQDAEAIVAQQRRCGTSVVQLCDRLAPGAHRELRRAMPGIGIVQVVHVEGEDAVAEALAVAPHVDAILLDSGSRARAVKELGGTGRAHDWTISRRIRDAAPTPVFLAGGLTPDNVGDAVARVAPFAVDVCSGVRSAGRLDASKVARFIAAARTPA